MAFADIPASLAGAMPMYSGTQFGQTNPTLFTTVFTFAGADAATDVLALVTVVPLTGTLTEMQFRTGTVSTAGADFDMGLYTVDTNGLNTTTPYATNSNGTVTVGTGDDNVWKAVAINSGTGVSVTRGDIVAVVLSVASGTPNTVQINGAAFMLGQNGNLPYRVENTAASLAKSANAAGVPFIWNYGGTYAYAQGCNAVSGGSVATIGNGAERGLRFQVPVPVRVSGCYVPLANVAAGGDYSVYLLGGSAPYTTLASVTGRDGDQLISTTADGYALVLFPTSVELSANTTYYLVTRQTTANAVGQIEWTVTSSTFLTAMPGGAQFYLANRDATAVTNNTAFTDTNTTVPQYALIVDGLSDGAGGGGGLRLAGHGGLAA